MRFRQSYPPPQIDDPRDQRYGIKDMAARFVCIEGGDGVGKSTLLEKIRAEFERQRIPIHFTREPGGTPFAEKVRDLILATTALDPIAELLLYEAARRDHVEHGIRPALGQGLHVICDRFTASTRAYQGAGRGLDLGLIDQLNRLTTAGLAPDLTLWLKLNPEISQQRTAHRGNTNRLDREGLTFHQRIFQEFEKMASEPGSHFLTLDAKLDPDALFASLLANPKWQQLWKP